MPRKLDERIPDADAESHGLLRVVDETGDDDLFPSALFMSIALTTATIRALVMAG